MSANYIYIKLQETILLVLVLLLVLSHAYEGTMPMGDQCHWGTRNVERLRASMHRREMNNVKTDAAVHRIVSFVLMVLACCSCF